MNKSTSPRRLIKNAIFNSGSWGINVVVMLIVTPYFIRKLTVEGYGVFALLLGLVGYYQLLDLGLAKGVTKFVAQFRATQDKIALHRSINAALVVQAIFGSVGSLLLVTSADKILELLHISTKYYNEAKLSLYICAVGFFIQMFASTFASVLQGLQRYDFTAKTEVGGNILFNLIGFLILYLGYGLATLVVWKILTTFFTFGLLIWATRRELGELGFLYGISKQYYKLLFSFSGFLFISQISNLFTNYIVRFVISFYLGPAAVTLYEVPKKILGVIGGFLSRASAVLFPYASELGAQNNTEQLKVVYINASKMFASIAVPLLLTIFVFSKHILTMWMGPHFAEKSWLILSIISGTGLLGSLTTVPNQIAIGLGYTKVKSFFSIIAVILYLIFLPLLTPKLGVTGAVLSVLLATGLPGFAFTIYTTEKIINISLARYLENTFIVHIIPTVISISVFQIIAKLPTTWWLAILSVFTILIYYALMIIIKWLPIKTIKLIRSSNLTTSEFVEG